MRVKQQKLDLLKNILNTDGSDANSTASSTPSHRGYVPKSRIQSSSQHAKSMAKSTPDLSTPGPAERTRSHTVSNTATTPRFIHNRTNTYTPSRTGPPVKPVRIKPSYNFSSLYYFRQFRSQLPFFPAEALSFNLSKAKKTLGYYYVPVCSFLMHAALMLLSKWCLFCHAWECHLGFYLQKPSTRTGRPRTPPPLKPVSGNQEV